MAAALVAATLGLTLAVTMADPATAGATASAGSAARHGAAQRPTYSLSEGPIINNARGSQLQKYRISNRLQRAIDNVPRGGIIRILSWNIMSRFATDHLLSAQRRGVRVRILMAKDNLSREVPNPQFVRLRNGLLRGNRNRRPYNRSYAKMCWKSCRGRGGQAHAKYYIFSQTGRSKKVVMEGSANFTIAAAINQWNDLYTWVNRSDLYNLAVRTFDQSWRDRPVRNSWVQQTDGTSTLAFSPSSGAYYHGSPELNLLNQVHCTGATHGNSAHHTMIRMFPDVMKQKRGLRAANRLRTLWNQGCDIKIGYTVMGPDVHRILARRTGRGPVPMRHLAIDSDHDGEYEMYFHLKVLTVNGVVGTDHAAYRLIQGSSNIANDSSASDENYGMFTGKYVTLFYQQHLNGWLQHPPIGHRSTGRDADSYTLQTTTGKTVDAGPDGYIAPGTMVISPTTGQPVDPYALIDQD